MHIKVQKKLQILLQHDINPKISNKEIWSILFHIHKQNKTVGFLRWEDNLNIKFKNTLKKVC